VRRAAPRPITPPAAAGARAGGAQSLDQGRQTFTGGEHGGGDPAITDGVHDPLDSIPVAPPEPLRGGLEALLERTDLKALVVFGLDKALEARLWR